jgi:hypothetical protein
MTKTEILEVLYKTRQLIADERNWCSGHSDDVHWFRHRWCLFGALSESVKRLGKETSGWFSPGNSLNERAFNHYGCSGVAVNDQLGHAAVIRLMDDTIAALELSVELESLKPRPDLDAETEPIHAQQR